MNKDDKLKALDAALTQIEKAYGKGSVMKLGDSSAQMNIETVPTGSLSLDIALGLGGVPKGRVIEVYGPESSGKTTVALHMVAEVQKRGGIAGFIDAEHALDPVYAKNIGVDIDNLYISQPDNGEQALEITETMVRSGAVDIVIVDSVAALVPKAAGIVQIRVIIRRNKATITRQQRRLGHQCLIQQVDQIVMPGQVANCVAQHLRRIFGQTLGNRGSLGQTGTDRGQITRTATFQRQPRQRPIHVGNAGKRIAQIGRQTRIINQLRHRVLPGMDQRQVA